jgi:hypothetical protein
MCALEKTLRNSSTTVRMHVLVHVHVPSYYDPRIRNSDWQYFPQYIG